MKQLSLICTLGIGMVILTSSRVGAQVVVAPGANQAAAAKKTPTLNQNLYRSGLSKHPLGSMPQRKAPANAGASLPAGNMLNNFNPMLMNRSAAFPNAALQGIYPGMYPNMYSGYPYFGSGMNPGMFPGAFQNRFFP